VCSYDIKKKERNKEKRKTYFCCVGGQFAISTHLIVHGLDPPPVQNQYVKQGTGGRRLVAVDAPCMGLA